MWFLRTLYTQEDCVRCDDMVHCSLFNVVFRILERWPLDSNLHSSYQVLSMFSGHHAQSSHLPQWVHYIHTIVWSSSVFLYGAQQGTMSILPRCEGLGLNVGHLTITRAHQFLSAIFCPTVTRNWGWRKANQSLWHPRNLSNSTLLPPNGKMFPFEIGDRNNALHVHTWELSKEGVKI